MLQPVLEKNDRKASILIITVSVIVFAAVTVLGKYNFDGKVDLPFDKHIFALINAVINATVSLLLLAGLITVKNRNWALHKKIMLAAMLLSILFYFPTSAIICLPAKRCMEKRMVCQG